jgi:hypothetical protein
LLSFFSSSLAAMTALSMPRLMSIGLRPWGFALAVGAALLLLVAGPQCPREEARPHAAAQGRRVS